MCVTYIKFLYNSTAVLFGNEFQVCVEYGQYELGALSTYYYYYSMHLCDYGQ